MPHFIVNDPIILAACVAVAAMGGGLIVFDGRPDSGKTGLAHEMARELGGTPVDADDYLDRNTGAFLGALRTDDLRRALERAAPPVLFSSLCAQQVLEKLGLSAEIIIWVEQASRQRLEEARRDFERDYDAEAADESAHSSEVEAYIAAYDARMRPDVVVYLNARD